MELPGALAVLLIALAVLLIAFSPIIAILWACVSTVRHQHRQTFYLKAITRAIERMEKDMKGG